MSWSPILLSLQLAFVTTLLLLLVGLPIAWWLSAARRPWKPVVESLVGLPLVLPPTVLGFYLLLAFSPNNAFGAWLDGWLGLQLVFSFPGLVVASVIYSLPFMVQPVQAGLEGLPGSLAEAATLMGKSSWTIFRRVQLPAIRPALWTGVVLSFAHTIGEFGVVLMIGGNLPGKTRVASIAVYDEVEALNYAAANAYSLVLLGLTFLILLLVYGLRGRPFRLYPNAA